MKRRINWLRSVIRLRHENGAVSVFPAVFTVFIMFLSLLIFTAVISIVIVIIIIVYCVCEFGNM